MIFARRARKRPPQTALEQIEAAENTLITVPWKGSPCMVKVRELSDIEIQAVGNFSLIETDEYKWSRAAPQVKVAWSELLAYAEKNLKLCKAALVSPSYEQIFETIGKNGFNAEVKHQIENINRQINVLQPGPARQELEQIRDSLELAWCIILPEDFMAGVVAYALGIHKSDIKKVTEEMLLNAAILADRGHKAPHEYIHGAFTDFNTRDIDTRALIIYEQHKEELRESAQQKRDA